MNEVTCIVFICDGIGPTALVAQRNGQGGYLGFPANGCRRGGSAWCWQECAVRKRVTGKTRRTVYPCKRAGVNALHRFLGEKTQRSCGRHLKRRSDRRTWRLHLLFCQPGSVDGLLHTAMSAISPWYGGLDKIGRDGGRGSRAGDAASSVYTNTKIPKSRLNSSSSVRIYLQGGLETCQSSEKFFFFNILGALRSPQFLTGIKKPARRLVLIAAQSNQPRGLPRPRPAGLSPSGLPGRLRISLGRSATALPRLPLRGASSRD